MKQRNQKLKEDVQRLMIQENELLGQIALNEQQINQYETKYLEKSWYEGNVYIGWDRQVPINNTNTDKTKITVDPKEKLFSLSSVASPAFAELGSNVDRQLAPYGQHRFESIKKKRSKKKNTSQMRRPRPIRKKKRR